MKSFYFRELKRYRTDYLAGLFGKTGEATVKKLLAANILRQVKNGDGDAEKSEMLAIAPAAEPMAVFNFCGLVLIDDILIRCYPKYIRKGDGKKEFPLILRALKRYEKHRRQQINFSARGFGGSNRLELMLAILDDYSRHGLYVKKELRFELNGEGETDWQRTLERYNPVFLKNAGGAALYMERDTVRLQSDEENFFRQLHMAVLNECSDTVKKLELDSLFPVRVHFQAGGIRQLGGREYILRRLQNEYRTQYAERRKEILKLLIMYLDKKAAGGKGAMLFYGTNAMNLVWEKALAETLVNVLPEKVKNIAGLDPVKRQQYGKKNNRLIDLIEKPCWQMADSGKEFLTDTLKPDTIAITDGQFIIYYAKYYVPKVASSAITRQPGLESVTKQFLYQMAYADFLAYFDIKKVRNVFLIPKESTAEGISKKLAKVKFNLLGKYTGNDIDVIELDAAKVWQAYAEGKSLLFS